MNKFTSTATREGRWWVVQCDQHPGALSQVARLDQAVAHQREAIAFVADLDQADVEVTVNPQLDPGVVGLVSRAREDRERAEHLAKAASEGFRKAAEVLAGDGFSLRDIGTVLGVSHQRIAQLLQ